MKKFKNHKVSESELDICHILFAVKNDQELPEERRIDGTAVTE